MKMDGRDSVECQNWEKNGINVIIKMLMNETKGKQLPSSSKGGGPKCERRKSAVAAGFFYF